MHSHILPSFGDCSPDVVTSIAFVKNFSVVNTMEDGIDSDLISTNNFNHLTMVFSNRFGKVTLDKRNGKVRKNYIN